MAFMACVTFGVPALIAFDMDASAAALALICGGLAIAAGVDARRDY